ncbi:MAG: GspE/PulE family protein [Fuerstiella sp.]
MTNIADFAISSGILDPARHNNYSHLQPNSAIKQIVQDTERRATVREPRSSREFHLLNAIARHFDLRLVTLTEHGIEKKVLELLSPKLLFTHCIVPVECTDETITVATSQPFHDSLLTDVARESGLHVDIVLAEETEILQVLKEQLGVAGATVGDLMADGTDTFDGDMSDETDPEKLAEQSSVVKLVNELLIDAVTSNASDIHIEPSKHSFGIRYRIDGMLLDQTVPQEISRFHAAIVSRLKIMAKLNVAEKRLPQDGRLTLSVKNLPVDVRVSIIPMMHGESIVLRLLRQSHHNWGLKTLHMPTSLETSFREVMLSPHGVLLVTGPTGSGKTTTLYNILHDIRCSKPETKIITIEDPVEYSLEGVHQIQVNESTGMTFARGLRSVLRHDPDIVLVGEIRDQETAKSAVEAALTGHFVLSTLHTNDSASAFTRLTEMGIEPYLVASTVRGVLAQRLLRRLCENCRQPAANDSAELPSTLSGCNTLYAPGGCRACVDSGYAGRSAVFEFLVSDNNIRRLCINRAPAYEILDYAKTRGLRTLEDAGWDLVREGMTSFQEVARVLGSGSSCEV